LVELGELQTRVEELEKRYGQRIGKMQSGWGLAAFVAAVGLILTVVLIAQAVGNLWGALALTLGPVGIIFAIVAVLRARGVKRESRRTVRPRQD
jgi:hypothetical protein